MSYISSLFEAVLRFPEEDTPRLMLADAIRDTDPARAEFIGVQIRLANYERERVAHEEIRAVHPHMLPFGGHCQCGRIIVKGDTPCPYCRDVKREGELCVGPMSWRIPEIGGMERGIESNGRCSWYVGEGPTVVSAMFSRGFVSSLTCSAADFLSHADALIWHPKQMDACVSCGGLGGKLDGYGVNAWVPCGCDKGRIPRPVPPTAQPITHVTLTTWPSVSWNEYGAAVNGRAYRNTLTGGDHDRRSISKRLLEGEFKGVTFDLPSLMSGTDDTVNLTP